VRLDPGDEINQMLHNGTEYTPRGPERMEQGSRNR
jgi:hypothetical protein